jgi:hypothetical protein
MQQGFIKIFSMFDCLYSQEQFYVENENSINCSRSGGVVDDSRATASQKVEATDGCRR